VALAQVHPQVVWVGREEGDRGAKGALQPIASSAFRPRLLDGELHQLAEALAMDPAHDLTLAPGEDRVEGGDGEPRGGRDLLDLRRLDALLREELLGRIADGIPIGSLPQRASALPCGRREIHNNDYGFT
jgi:hypothetical protein